MRQNNSVHEKALYNNVTLKPFSYIKPSLGAAGNTILVLLVPQLVMLALTQTYSALLVVLSSVLAALSAEFLYSLVKRQFKFSWLNTVIQGMIIGLLLPQTYPPLQLFFIVLFSMFLSKYAFGGFASSWANPAAVTIAVAYMLNMAAFPVSSLTTLDLQSRNAALTLIQNGTVPQVQADASVTAFLNHWIFNLFGIDIPEGYVSLFWDCHSVIPAFRFNLLTIFSSIVLISLDMVDALIPSVFIVVYAAFVRFAGPFFVGGIPFQGDILLALLTSGTLFGTLYVLQWYGTTPVTAAGKIVYGVLGGITAFFIMGLGLSSVGFVFTVLVLNVISTLIQVVESKQTRKKIENILVPRINLMKEAENV